MLVYANTLSLKPETDIEMVLLLLENWLEHEAGEKITLSEPLPFNPYHQRIDDKTRLSTARAEEGKNVFFAMRYSRRDDMLPTRYWNTTVTFKHECSEIETELPVTECKIIVEIQDLSPSDQKPEVFAPPIVARLMKYLPLTVLTPPLSITSLESDEAVWELDSDLELDDRRYALIIVAPDKDGKMPINLNRLAYLTAGMAHIFKIPNNPDDWDYVFETLGSKFTPRGGEVKIILPVSRSHGFYIPQHHYSVSKLAELQAAGESIEHEMFRGLCSKISRLHIQKSLTPELVAKFSRRQSFEGLKQKAKEVAIDEVTQEIEDIFNKNELEVEKLRLENQQLKDENRRIKYELQSLKDAFQTTLSNNDNSIDVNYLKNIFDLISERFLLEDSLALIQELFGQRIVVLDSAFKAAREGRLFREKQRAFNLLWKLSTEYWQALSEGKPDAQARIIFGDDYSARESESVEKNRVARQLRTFKYQGREIEMMAHLRIGVKDSAVETLRVHFIWLADAQKIVIGHCGKHLNFG